MRARIVAPDELTAKDLAGWSQCAASSLEPNPFLEPDWLLPALEHLDESPNARLVLAEQGDAVLACVPIAEVTADQTGTACQGRRSALETRVAPTAVALGTPLVAEEGGCEALACLMSEIGREAQRRGSGLVVMEWMGYDGPITRLLKQLAVETNHTFIEFDVWERASLCRQVRAEEGYWLRGIGKNRRRTMRQHHLHLEAALGTSPSVRTRTDDAAVATFMRLEASGWKGHQPGGLALGLRATTTRFFEEVCHRYLDSGRMWFLSLEGGGTPIAMLCCVRAGETVFACRTAYDENLAKFGPGVEIFLAAMEHFVRETDAQCFDTCAARDNQHLLALFPDRRAMATVMFRLPTRHGTEPVHRGVLLAP